ncbi:MAG: ATP-binding cassette domain-containing protein [Chloroflexi bacterium]|nr:ATP-binding cassette domain-containing protein [Chloroflexota bacterium]
MTLLRRVRRFHERHDSVEPGAKIGLVGPNGIGKTSCSCSCVAGAGDHRQSQPCKDGLRLAISRQEAMQAFHEATNTVWEEMMSVFAGVHGRKPPSALEQRMADETDSDALQTILDEYSVIQEQFEAMAATTMKPAPKATLQGLGFCEADTPRRSCTSAAGKRPALLARLLLSRPDLLVLDEPTNHLDIGAVQWLERTSASGMARC